MRLKFSPANVKIAALSQIDAIKPFLQNKRKVYSLDLLSGWSCPGAKDCLSKVLLDSETGKRSIQDGPNTQFRCFSASQEVVYTNVYKLRKHNLDLIRSATSQSFESAYELLENSMPTNLGVCRFHVGGDFINHHYMMAASNLAANNSDRLFYAYTKSINYWVRYLKFFNSLPNFILTASYGGRYDSLIGPNKLRTARVVFHPSETDLDIDHDDSHAADPSKKNEDFALLIHGVQPKDSGASKALKVLRTEEIDFAYSR